MWTGPINEGFEDVLVIASATDASATDAIVPPAIIPLPNFVGGCAGIARPRSRLVVVGHGRYVAVAIPSGSYLVDVAEKKVVRRLSETSRVHALTASRDGRWLAGLVNAETPGGRTIATGSVAERVASAKIASK